MTSNASLLQRRTSAVPRGVGTAMPIFAARALNAELWDVEGRRYIDFAAGIAVLNVGHCHPRVLAAAHAQLDQYTHTAFQVAAYEPYIALAERLNELAPIQGPAKTILFSTGAEAVENAVKIARKATGRSAVVAFSGGFHGRSFMAMALTGKTAPYKRGFGPMPGEVFHVPFPVAHQGIDVAHSLKALQQVFKADVAADEVAAIIIEPVQGEGGFHIAPPALLQALREIAHEHGIVLIADEVQSGFARTGRLFGIEHSGIQPDLITVAKSLAGGFPLSGVIGRAELMDAAGLPVQTLEAGGLDHGIWTPLRYIYPDADVPVLPLSFSPHDSPAALMALGRALAPLADEGVLIIGSGSLTHNLRLIYGPGGQPDVAAPETAETGAFRHWVAERTAARDWAALRDYRRQAPHAAFMHPTDEHWLPFYVAAGAGGEAATPRRLHASVTYGVLAMDLYAFGAGADTLAEETRDAVAA